MSDRSYDVVIIGAGLGGLECAITLAREGMKVCVLEKNHQLGGSLQVFSRDKTVFDTGVHYIGGLDPGQNLHSYFTYYGIMDKLKLHRMDANGFDHIELPNDPRTFKYAQGWDNFTDQLAEYFPKERAGIAQFGKRVVGICDRFPLYRLRYSEDPDWMNADLMLNARETIASFTDDPLLRNVLAGSNGLYAGDRHSPFYVHALVVNSYIESSWRCIDGGSQIAKHLASNARKDGAVILSRKTVTGFEMGSNGVSAVLTADGDRFECKWCVSNTHPHQVLDLLGPGHLRPAYTKRIRSLKNTVASFTLHLAMKPGTFPYLDHNIYSLGVADAWDAVDYDAAEWPSAYMLNTPLTSKSPDHAEAVTVMAYMRYEEWEQWAEGYNTVTTPGERPDGYTAFKEKCEQRLLDVVERRFPGIRSCVRSIHSSTPITFRDYIGTSDGSMYGVRKDSSDPLRTFIAPRTKVPNLLLTGQNMNMHGLLGVTVSAVATCGEMVGKRHLLDRIHTSL